MHSEHLGESPTETKSGRNVNWEEALVHMGSSWPKEIVVLSRAKGGQN